MEQPNDPSAQSYVPPVYRPADLPPGPVAEELRRRAARGRRSTGRPVQPNIKINGEKLRAIRLDKDISGGEVAAVLGIRSTSYYSYERNLSRPSASAVLQIAEILSCQPEDFIDP